VKLAFFNSDQILSRGRYPWVDYARGISILLVCYRHVFEGLVNVGVGSNSYPLLKYSNIFFFSFRMPLFFIVSGIFLGGSLLRKGTGNYIGNRVQTILYPLLLWGSIHITLQLIFADYVNATAYRQPTDYLSLILQPRRVEQFWYLNALFFVGVLYVLIKEYLKFNHWHQIILGLLMYAAAGYLHINNIEVGFLIDVLFFYFFFAIGDLAADIFLNEKNYKFLSSAKTLLLLLPAFGLLQYYFTELNLKYQDDYFVQYKMPALYAITALVGGAFVLNVSFILQRLNIFRFLRVIGYHSLYIYVMHLMITAATRIMLVRVFGMENIPLLMLISVTAGIIIPIIFFNIMEQLGAWWLFTLKRKEPRKVVARNVQPYYHGAGIVTPKESVSLKKDEKSDDGKRAE